MISSISMASSSKKSLKEAEQLPPPNSVVALGKGSTGMIYMEPVAPCLVLLAHGVPEGNSALSLLIVDSRSSLDRGSKTSNFWGT